MPVAADAFGIAYLDAATFRSAAEMFGVGMALADYPATDPGSAKLALVLQAASRAVDAFCGRDFDPADRTETHQLDLSTWQFPVNNPPVASVSSCIVRYAIDGTIVIPVPHVYINNQKGYCEIVRAMDATVLLAAQLGTEIAGPQVEVTYKSLQSVPKAVALGTGFQAGHMINTGFVDKTLPPNFGSVDLDGLKLNNKKGNKSADEMVSGSFSADAERVLMPYKRIAVG